jgi:hypothetical protein
MLAANKPQIAINALFLGLKLIAVVRPSYREYSPETETRPPTRMPRVPAGGQEETPQRQANRRLREGAGVDLRDLTRVTCFFVPHG